MAAEISKVGHGMGGKRLEGRVSAGRKLAHACAVTHPDTPARRTLIHHLTVSWACEILNQP